MNLAAIEAAIVDLDGTMVDTLGDFEAVLAQVSAGLGLPRVDRAFVARTVGRGSEHLLRRMLESLGASAALYDAAWALFQQHYAMINGRHAEVFPGVPEGLAAMRARGWRLACVTNKPEAFARSLLESKGLLGSFEHVFGGDAFARKKPDPLPLIEACRALRSTPEATLVIGDSSNDAQAARAAGCPVLLVGYGYNHGEPVDAVDADGVIERLDRIG